MCGWLPLERPITIGEYEFQSAPQGLVNIATTHNAWKSPPPFLDGEKINAKLQRTPKRNKKRATSKLSNHPKNHCGFPGFINSHKY